MNKYCSFLVLSFSILVLFLSAGLQANAASKKCIGEVVYGSLDSAVGDCTFITKSIAWIKIIKKCSLGDICEVQGTSTKNLNVVDNVISVRLIRKSQ